ncbi:hypothetical protein BYT27DRAFT_6344636 [Phlegmacium glaucopus]|nr:hypothetical protein BYT27DRAFT_6344636 [Phlegmacium glaucopus]
MFLHTNDPGIDLNHSCSVPRQSFGRAVGNRFPRPSCGLDANACSRNRHATLYSTEQSAGTPLHQRKIPSTELPRSNGDNLGLTYQHKNYSCRETLHEMRNPAVDPCKSRRHGTDFGLGRYAESWLTVLDSDHQNPSQVTSVPVPPTTMRQDDAVTDGDSVSSLFECSALDFPQPPPISSPVIRRMRSSPWFPDNLSEGFPNQGSRRPRRSASVLLDSDIRSPCYPVSSFATQQPTMGREILCSGRHNSSDMVDETINTERARLHLSPYPDLGINYVNLEMVGEALVGLDMNASNLVPQELVLDNSAYGAPSPELSQPSDSGYQFVRSSHLHWSTPSDLLRWSTSHRSPPLRLAPMPPQRVPGEDTKDDDYGDRIFRTKTKAVFSLPSANEHQDIRSFGRLPRIIRKVASMRSDTRPDDTSCILLGSTGPRTIPKSRSFRSIPLVACEPGNSSSNSAYNTITTFDGAPHQHNDWSFANLNYFSSSKDARDLKCPFSPTLNDSLRSFEHCKGRGTHKSFPSLGLEGSGSETAQHKAEVTGIRPMALSDPFVHRESCNRPLAKPGHDLPNGTDKSFIDITPNQGKHERSAAATKRARVKKLIARAGHGIIGWGKQLTRKNSFVK